nr:immunoglobulin light chain junction region [Macaca mulatta]
CMQYTHMPFSF